jgi:thiamine pyrophosphate-dependent acetolactate synthase large subunit-like protein
MQTLGDLLRGDAPELAKCFDAVPIPPAFRLAFVGPTPETTEYVRYARLEAPGERIAILAGPHVVQHVDGLHAFAEHVGAPVANTWGAKGIYQWDDPHHMGTCGLQARDFELLGLGTFDLVVTTGLDPLETPTGEALREILDVETLDVEPKFLGTLSDYTRSRSFPITANALYEALASVAQPGYVDDRTPRHPARAVMDLKQSLEPDAVVTVQPGPAGLWVARTFPTDRPSTVFVPPTATEGIAAALALVAARAGRPATCVVDHVDDITEAFVARARAHGWPMWLDDWGDSVDFALTRELVDAAGPVVAWSS